jgi:hypothetical protein
MEAGLPVADERILEWLDVGMITRFGQQLPPRRIDHRDRCRLRLIGQRRCDTGGRTSPRAQGWHPCPGSAHHSGYPPGTVPGAHIIELEQDHRCVPGSRTDEHRCRADDVTKPFSLEEVLARLRGLLRRAGIGRSRGEIQLAVDDLTMDEDAREVRRGGDLIELTATEFELLRFLMRNPRRMLSEAQILDRVWKYDFGG